MLIFCFKQKTAYEMRISDWSSDVCSSDLAGMTVRCRKIISAPLRPSRPQHDLPHRLAPLEHRKAFAPVGEVERGVDVRPDPARRRQRVDRRDILDRTSVV